MGYLMLVGCEGADQAGMGCLGVVRMWGSRPPSNGRNEAGEGVRQQVQLAALGEL